MAANLKAGLNYREIAEALDVGLGTIARDVKIILGRWQKEQVSEIDGHVILQLAQVDSAINAIWKKVIEGNFGAVDRLIKLLERKAKLLGLDKPTTIAGPDGGPIQSITYIVENRLDD